MDEAEAAEYARRVSEYWSKINKYEYGLGNIGKREFLYRLISARIRKPGLALDIGTSTGKFCHVLNSLGFDAYGVDPDEVAVGIAQKNGLKVFKGMFPGGMPDELLAKRYSLITLKECLCFLNDMRKAFQLLHEMLAPGGFLLIKMHQGTSLFYRESQKSLFSRHGDYVQGFVTAQALQYMLTQSGFIPHVLKAYPENNLKFRFGLQFPPRLMKLEVALESIYIHLLRDLGTADRLVALASRA